jgi:SCP-2 sterol transfer family
MSAEAGAAGSSPTGLVTLIVGEVGRGGAGARSRRPSQATAPEPAEGPPPGPAQWSCQWSVDGPGPVSTGLEGEADLTLTLSPDDARSVKDGQLDPSVAFMQGRLKTSGDNALLLSVLEWTATPAFPSALSSWAKPGPTG